MGVPENHRRVVAEHVDAVDAVRIPDPAALAARDVQGIRVEVRGGAGRASWHDPDRLLVNGSRPGCQLPVDGFCVDHIGEATTDSVGGWGETSLDALRLVRVRSIGLAQHSAQPLLRDCQPRCDGALRDAQRLRDGAVGVAVVVPEHDRGRLLGRQLGQGQREISALDLLLRIRRTLRPPMRRMTSPTSRSFILRR